MIKHEQYAGTISQLSGSGTVEDLTNLHQGVYDACEYERPASPNVSSLKASVKSSATFPKILSTARGLP